MQCASEGPVKLVLQERYHSRLLVMPSQTAMYSGRFGINRHTTSPLPRPWSSAHRAYWLAARQRTIRQASHGRRAGLARRRTALQDPRSLRESTRSGWRGMAAVSSSARNHAFAAGRRSRGESLSECFSCGAARVDRYNCPCDICRLITQEELDRVGDVLNRARRPSALRRMICCR